MTEYYFSADNKLKTAKLFVQNLLWGIVEIDYEKFESVEEGKKLAAELYHKITWWDNEVLCGDDDPKFVDKTVDWIYDFINKGRSFGAIRGQLRDKMYDQKIDELEKEVQSLREKNSELRGHNIQLAEELVDRNQQISTYERQFYKHDGDQE
jgi:hypothetical protein